MPRLKEKFPNFRAFGFSIVVHNVNSQSKEFFQKFAEDQKPLWSVLSLEPYPDQSGHHLHIFIKWKNQRWCRKWFVFHHNILPRIMLPKPVNAPDGWGRIQVDTLYGTKDDCIKYLVNPDKDKPLDEDVKIIDYERLDFIERWSLAAARLNRKFIFPETHGLDKITCFEYCRFLESRGLPIPEYYFSDWNVFNQGLPPREY